jgi:hypothetical protein
MTLVEQHLRNVHRMLDVVPDPKVFLERYIALAAHDNAMYISIQDAFSSGQIDSKLWLIDVVSSLRLRCGNTWTLCGWIGTLGYLMLLKKAELGLASVRSFDIDPHCADLADTLNKMAVSDGWKFKATTLDVNDLRYGDGITYLTTRADGQQRKMPTDADTIINTSCDHMGSDRTWWDSIPSDRLIILQNNDWFENDQHNNSVNDSAEFAKMYPMRELLFSGELNCTLYKRFMLIGRK